MTNQRLSNAELDELLSAKAEPMRREDDDAEAADLKQLLATLRENATEVAAHHRALARRKPEQTSRVVKPLPRAAWGLCAAALAVSIVVPVEIHHHRAEAQEQARAHEYAVRQQQMEQATDEALLQNVETDISSSVPRSLQPLSVKLVSESTGNMKGSNEQ